MDRSEPGRGAGLVLVVDDDLTTRQLARVALEEAGFAVEEAADGAAAVDRFAALRPDLLLLDVVMPGLDGFAVCDRIRQSAGGGDVPVVMLTGLHDTETIERAYEAGATDFITKPLPWALLGHRARYLLRASRTSAALRQSEARLNNAQALARLGSWDWDTRERRLDGSATLRHLLGVDRATSSAPRVWLRRVHRADRRRLLQTLRLALEGRDPSDLDLRLSTDGGTVRWVHHSVRPVRDGGGALVGVTGAVLDITQGKRREDLLRQSEQRFRELVETSSGGIAIVRDGRVLYANPALERRFGPLPSSASFVDYFRVVPEDRDRAPRLWAGGSPSSGLELRCRQTGSDPDEDVLVWLYCRGSRPIPYRGAPATLIDAADVTRLKDLERLVVVREKMACLGHVAAGLAHEVRNPLSGVNVYLDLLCEAAAERDDASELEEIVGQAKGAAQKIETVIKRVIDFARPSAPHLSMQSLNVPALEAVELSRVTLRKSGVELACELEPELPDAYVDPPLIEQVVLNLISNAAQALEGHAGPKRIRMTTGHGADRVWLRVEDSGPGVSPEFRKRIFEPFVTTRSQGSGIGLSLCQRIVADHGGALDLSDSPLGGAAFTVRIPVEKRGEAR